MQVMSILGSKKRLAYMMLNIQNGRTIKSVASIMRELQVEWRKKVRSPFLNSQYKNTISDTKRTLEMVTLLHIPL